MAFCAKSRQYTRSLPVTLLTLMECSGSLYSTTTCPHCPCFNIDFTCCDFDPGVIARNVLLLTMIIDNKLSSNSMWNIFYHMRIDDGDLRALVDHCRKLISLSEDLGSWVASPYGPFLPMSTAHTLCEARRHWRLYVDMHDLPPERLGTIESAFTAVRQDVLSKGSGHLTALRSAGPALLKALVEPKILIESFMTYRTTGITGRAQSIDKLKRNPTFVYSLAGEGCSVHYDTDPLTGFHLASFYGNNGGRITADGILRAVKTQFNGWCIAYRLATSAWSISPVVRYFLGDALAVCHALRCFSDDGSEAAGIPVQQLSAQYIKLDTQQYTQGIAPVVFDVVDTSNLENHVGLFNLIIATRPILSRSPSSVLYTESFGSLLGNDPAQEFTMQLFADLTVFGLLINLSPVDYLCGFNVRSVIHELASLDALNTEKRGQTSSPTGIHQLTTWKSPMSCDHASVGGRPPMSLESLDLGAFLYDMYRRMFEQEDSLTFYKKNKRNISNAITSSNITHYNRESFVLFLKLVKATLQIPEDQWVSIITRFISIQDIDGSCPMDTVNRHDFRAQLLSHRVFMDPTYVLCSQMHIAPFASWRNIPLLVRVFLTVPRDALLAAETVSTPPLLCGVLGPWSFNTFSSVHVTYGRATVLGPEIPRVHFDEDPRGHNGTSSLVVSFIAPSSVFTSIEDPKDLSVCLGVRSTPASVSLTAKLGPSMILYKARVMDGSRVQIVAHQPAASTSSLSHQHRSPEPFRLLKDVCSDIGDLGPVHVELDENCENLTSFMRRLDVTAANAQHLLSASGGKLDPTVSQNSPCMLRLSLGPLQQDIIFPYPISVSRHKVRVARRSLWIEIVVLFSATSRLESMRSSPYPFVWSKNGSTTPWNITRINLVRSPSIDLSAKKLDTWLGPQIGSMFSTHERQILKEKDENRLAPARLLKEKDEVMLAFVKSTLHAIFVQAAGIQGDRRFQVFALTDETTRNSDTVIFVSDLKYDFDANTFVCDAFVLPLTHELMECFDAQMQDAFGRLVTGPGCSHVKVYETEMRAWKHLLPAFAERCRTWEHSPNCEYKAAKRIPLCDVMEEDPLCSCGRGKDVTEMTKRSAWKPFAPLVTRIALSPLFSARYPEPPALDPSSRRCYMCRQVGKPKLMQCSGCSKVQYCGNKCQKRDWATHKQKCTKG
ncbi:hypothetical protein FISHEDRAFT_66605 [Fistulina hepatica ATCC 64428]|uniref:MYND-type domain-containing protein n=1 Tax=Fistulina hepatica ATCC 64428 TaxID=1128425 RepID=A0A0D7A556_9AGAR|nr:hypothetical protein FISHEDRAFT_66605 [Fistulina hepatica ATCC 64428]